MSGGDHRWHEEIDAVALFRAEAAVADAVGFRDGGVELSLDADHVAVPVALSIGNFVGRRGAQAGDVSVFSGLVDDSAHDVRVHDEASKSHGIIDRAHATAVELAQNVVAAEPTALAHIQFMRPPACFGELPFWQTELTHAVAEFRWDAGIIREEVKVPLLVVHMLLKNLLALLIAGIHPAEASADEVEGHGASCGRWACS